MDPKTRKFRVGDGRTVVLPASLDEGTQNTRLESGSIVTLEVARIKKHARHVNSLIHWGDLVELDVSAPAAPVKE